MVSHARVRETPMSSPLSHGIADPAHPDVSAAAHREPKLAVDQIQGNIIPGFLKDFETLIFLTIDDPESCKSWLKSLVPLIATAEEVVAFNRLFKAIRTRRDAPSNAVKSTWVNIAFSYSAIQQLTAGGPADVAGADFIDNAFKSGLAARSAGLNDPTEGEGSPSEWRIGGPGNEADILLIVQSDDRDDLFAQVEEIEDSIYASLPDGTPASSGVSVMFKQHGANLPGSLSGHEHFGFLDGVSQPGIRGVVSGDPTDVLTPRQNPRDPNQGKPGQDLLWPGEFVFGYEYQDPTKPIEEPSGDTTETTDPITGDAIHSGRQAGAGPDWAVNGSFLVFRRLRQDVEGFHTFLNQQAKALGALDPRFLGAKIVGRWPTGAPILRAETADVAALGNDDCANNDFEFFSPDPSLANPADVPPDLVPHPGTSDQCAKPSTALFGPSPADPGNTICPASAHIRKAYPRDDETPAGAGGTTGEAKHRLSEQNTQTHRLLRRGLPYGAASSSTPEAPLGDGVDRGLLFVAYMTSIVGQFEFVTRAWVNNENFRDTGDGFDLILGQASDHTVPRQSQLKLPGRTVTLSAPKDWVIPTGGGYFFAPSLDALANVLAT